VNLGTLNAEVQIVGKMKAGLKYVTEMNGTAYLESESKQTYLLSVCAS
jgi:hypothetical protein